jgi:hypothetical protein
MKDMLQH